MDAFIIGSELKGLTRTRGSSGFPFVTVLRDIAADARQMLGATAKITYAADWSEYAGFVPEGTNDLRFPLDALWAHPAINAVGIDNYMPLSDWRDDDWDGNNPDNASGPNDATAIAAAIEAGEGFDWFYADDDGRTNRNRLPITDGAYGKPWVYRFKDVRSWWMNRHYERINGIEAAQATAWVPGSKPLWFTELGCPAIDKGANQPNLFPDPKSSAAGIPYFSHGGRDDEAQANFLKAHLGHWQKAANNPVHAQTGIRMLDTGRIYLWTWDARPCPIFPNATDTWGDGANWQTGHWLNGRMTNVALSDLITEICRECAITGIDVSGVDAIIGGYALYGPATAREALDSLLALFRIDVSEANGKLAFLSMDRALPRPLVLEGQAERADDTLFSESRETIPASLPEYGLQFRDPLHDHKVVAVTTHAGDGTNGTEMLDLALAIDPGEAEARVTLLRDAAEIERCTLKIATSLASCGLVPGDRFTLPDDDTVWRVARTADGSFREIEAVNTRAAAILPRRSVIRARSLEPRKSCGAPHVIAVDIPALPTDIAATGPRWAAWLKPWRPLVALGSATGTAFQPRGDLPSPAMIGVLEEALPPGFPGLLSQNQTLLVRLNEGGLQSVTDAQLLAGANACAVRSAGNCWEVLQFGMAEEVSADLWRLTHLLRGQLATVEAAAAGAPPGADFVLLDQAVKSSGMTESEMETGYHWLIGPAGEVMSTELFAPLDTFGPDRAALTNAPVHVTAARRQDGSVAIQFIRTGLADADGWEAPEIPLREPSERYRLRFMTTAQAVRREIETGTSSYIYPAALKAADFGADSDALVEIAQLDRCGRPGLAARLAFNL